MKWFLISLAIGLATSDKLDRTYLPPPGAQFSGGILGSQDAPLEPPHHTHSGPGTVVGGHEGSQPNFGINGEPVNFGDKIPKVPVTTTSYAFSQTTTYPSGKGFETTVLPINPVTGLPIQFQQGNLPYGPSQEQQNIIHNLPSVTQSQAPTYGTNFQPSFDPQDSTSALVNYGSPGYDQFANQPLDQYPGQNVITPGGAPQIPESVYSPNQGQLQYPGGQVNAEQQRFPPTAAPGDQRIDQYPGQNVISPGGVIQIPGSNQGLQFPDSQTVTRQHGSIPSTGSPIHLQPGGNQHRVNYDGSQAPISQGIFTGQPINMQNLGGTQLTPNQEPIHVGGVPSQYPNNNQNYGPSVPTGSENLYLPSSTPTIPSSYNNGVSSTTALPGVTSSSSSYSSVGPVYRPERPQAAADRNAVILNYENIRTPNGYSYSFDTSNGIHAHESGIVDDGTKAQGAYSYIGDDGKVYSVTYTADENGFQPRGDHLPTPPPIPEAIQRVIEQAARDKAAGIVHDGSYDEEKYGDRNYQGTAYRRRPQNQFENDQFNEQRAQADLIKPIAGIKDVIYNEGVAQDQINNNLPVTGPKKVLNGKLPERRPFNQINRDNSFKGVPEGTGIDLGDGDSLIEDFGKNGLPIVKEGINQLNNYSLKEQENLGHRPTSNGVDLPIIGTDDTNQNNLPGTNYRGPSSRQPISGGVNEITEKYPGSNVDVGSADNSETERDRFDNSEGQDIESDSPSISDGLGENINSNFDGVTGAPIAGDKKVLLRQRIKGIQRPGSTGNKYSQNKNIKPQGETYTQENTETPSFGDYFKNAIANQQVPQKDETGYHYQQPNNKFEQNTFPTRFSPQEVSSTRKPDQSRSNYVEGTTRKPFMTPNVYNKNDRNSQSAPNVFNQNNRNSQSTTRRPFTTIGVTSPVDNSYTDYDDGENYATDQDIGDGKLDSTEAPAEKNGITLRPYQTKQTRLRTQNIPSGQRNRVNQKNTVTPGRRTDNSGTMSPGYTYGPTTQMPSHNSRFGSTEIPRRVKPQQRRPSTTDPDSITATSRPVTTQFPSGVKQSDYKYQTAGPVSKYSDSNVGSGFPTTGSFPGFGSMSTTPGASTPQEYYTSTYGPSQGYTTTTATPPNSEYTLGSSSQVPSGTPMSFQPSQPETFHTGYHYGPPKSGSFNIDGPGLFPSTGNSEIFPTSPTGPYQTTYQQGPGGFPSTTLIPLSPEKQGTFIPSQPGTFAPETSPINYQGNYQNGPSTPDYGTTIVSSTPGGKPIFGYPGPHEAQQDTTRYEYGPPRPTLPTTDSPLTIGTTPGSFIPSGTNGPSQDYSTTYGPGLQTTKDSYVGGPVDGFGRPITTGHDGLHHGFAHPTQGTTGPVNNLGPNFGVTDQTTKYPGSYDQPRVTGEDFSGPKQPQRYDPKTGYHYK